MNRPRLPIFFMHVPKCAGKSIHVLLSQKVSARDICPQPPHGVWTWRADEVRGYALYSGHFFYDFIREIDPNGTKLTILRHPLSRVVSTYDFWRSYHWEYIRESLPEVNGPAVAKAGTFGDFLESGSDFVQTYIYNTAARQLLGSKFATIWPDDEALIAQSREVLRGFDWVGVTEAFEPSMRSLSQLLGLRPPRTQPREGLTYDAQTDPNRELVEKTQPTEAERRRILEGNRVDLALYEEACALLGVDLRKTTLM
jgi:Sulfotransferase family